MATTILIPQPSERAALWLIGPVYRWLREHLKSRRQRRRLRALLDKDARLLDDIGAHLERTPLSVRPWLTADGGHWAFKSAPQ